MKNLYRFLKFSFLTFGVVALFPILTNASDEIIRQYRSQRANALGGTFVTTGDYVDALFGNPARHAVVEESRLILPELNLEANTGLLFNISKLTNIKGGGSDAVAAFAPLMGKNLHTRMSLFLGGFTPHFFSERWAFGFGFLTNIQINLLAHYNTQIDSQSYVDIGPHLGVAYKWPDLHLSVGANVHYNYRVASDRRISALDFLGGTSKIALKSLGAEGGGFDLDLGAYYQLPWQPRFTRISTGLSFNNIISNTYQQMNKKFIAKDSGVPPPRNPRTVAFGVRNEWPDFWIFRDHFTAVEVTDIGSLPYMSSAWKRVHLGYETRLTHWFVMRAGLQQGYLSGGLGFNFAAFKLDMSTWGEELGPNAGVRQDRRVGLRLAAEF